MAVLVSSRIVQRNEHASSIKQLKSYFTANDIDSAKKWHTILLACCGAATYDLIHGLVALSKPTVVSYVDFVDWR